MRVLQNRTAGALVMCQGTPHTRCNATAEVLGVQEAVTDHKAHPTPMQQSVSFMVCCQPLTRHPLVLCIQLPFGTQTGLSPKRRAKCAAY